MSSKERSVVLWGGVSVGVGFAVYLLLQLLAALFVVKGAVPEDGVGPLQVLGGGIAAACGGFVAVRVFGRGVAALLTAVCMTGLVVLAGFLIYGDIVMDSAALARILAILVGGLVVDLLAGKRGKRGRKRMTHIRKA